MALDRVYGSADPCINEPFSIKWSSGLTNLGRW